MPPMTASTDGFPLLDKSLPTGDVRNTAVQAGCHIGLLGELKFFILAGMSIS